jgi:hypothetical protein
MFCARHYDVVALARPTGPNGLPPDLLERLLFGCGRPLLIASPQRSDPLLGTVMVCWNETRRGGARGRCRNAAPVKTERVVLAGVEEHDPPLADGLTDLSRQMAWHGITAEAKFMSSAAGPAGEVLKATAHPNQADLLVMGS